MISMIELDAVWTEFERANGINGNTDALDIVVGQFLFLLEGI